MKNRITELRKTQKITQDELAKALKVSRQTVFCIENDKYEPSLPLAFKIAHHFGLRIEEVFEYQPEENA
ncbi:helix-turn-helix transcriptional regulator [Undibacterium sp. JH2W]|uniref:helix-turn-helix transcriptional regulator n=1 Tax=Undibacterium sp. JH2W TaxID=3413037 RepID=UPI003BF2060F